MKCKIEIEIPDNAIDKGCEVNYILQHVASKLPFTLHKVMVGENFSWEFEDDI